MISTKHCLLKPLHFLLSTAWRGPTNTQRQMTGLLKMRDVFIFSVECCERKQRYQAQLSGSAPEVKTHNQFTIWVHSSTSRSSAAHLWLTWVISPQSAGLLLLRLNTINDHVVMTEFYCTHSYLFLAAFPVSIRLEPLFPLTTALASSIKPFKQATQSSASLGSFLSHFGL